MEFTLLQQAAVQIKRVTTVKAAAIDRALSPIRLTMSQWAVLDAVRRQPDLSSHALAQISFMTDQSFGELAAKLTKRRLISRYRGSGRSILHRLTPTGAELLELAAPLMARQLAALFADLSDAEVGNLVDLLSRLNADTAA